MRPLFICCAILAGALPLLPASIQSAKPEQLGFSTERLARIHEMVQRHIDTDEISGAVTLVARNRKVARAYIDLTDKGHVAREGLRRQACDLFIENIARK